MKTNLFEFQCPSCHTRLCVGAADVGEAAQCPACGVGFLIPSPSPRSSPKRSSPRASSLPGSSSPRASSLPGSSSPRASSLPGSSSRRVARRSSRPLAAIVLSHPPPASRDHPLMPWVVLALLITLFLLGLSIGHNGGLPLPEPPPPTPTPLPGPGGLPRTFLADTRTGPGNRVYIVGLIPSLGEVPVSPARTLRLIDQVGLRNIGFVAEVSSDQQTILWQSLFGGNLLEPVHLSVAENGELLLGAIALSRLPGLGLPGTQGVEADAPVVVRVSADGSRIRWIRPAGTAGQRLSHFRVEPGGAVSWSVTDPSGNRSRNRRLDAEGRPL